MSRIVLILSFGFLFILQAKRVAGDEMPSLLFSEEVSIALVIMTYNRPASLARCLQSIARCPTCSYAFRGIYVSVDGGPNINNDDNSELGAIRSSLKKSKQILLPSILRKVQLYLDQGVVQEQWVCEREPNLVVDTRAHISRHFSCAINKAMEPDRNHSFVVVLEDDMVVGWDFGAIFYRMAQFWSSGNNSESLFCVSAWNDNGMKGRVSEKHKYSLFFNDFFPGLGWMISKELWENELRDHWPDGVRRNASTGWDHWIRIPDRMKNRYCISPVIPRTRNLGDSGANMKMSEFKAVLESLAFIDDFSDASSETQDSSSIPWHRTLESYLASAGNTENHPWIQRSDVQTMEYLLPDKYNQALEQRVKRAKRLSNVSEWLDLQYNNTDDSCQIDLTTGSIAECPAVSGSLMGDYLVLYRREAFVDTVAQRLGIFPSPRAGYHGLQMIFDARFPDTTLFLADARSASFISPTERINPHPEMQKTTSKQGKSCSDACQSEGLACDASQMEFMNSCSMLAAVFPCEQGCNYETGLDMPAYVVPSAYHLSTRGQCLIAHGGYPNGGMLRCDGSYPYTKRLCACVPIGSSGL